MRLECKLTTLRLRLAEIHLFGLPDDILNRVVYGRHLLHHCAVHHFETDLAVNQPAGLHIIVKLAFVRSS